MSGFGASGWGGTLVSGGGGGGGGIGITNFTPTEGTDMQPSTHVTFDATAAAGLTLIIVTALYEQTGAHEVIYDGTEFAPNFAQFSNMTVIANGFHFDISRRAGWPFAPTIKVAAADAVGGTSKV